VGLPSHTEDAERVRVGIVAGRPALAASPREQQSFEIMDIGIAEPVSGANRRPACPFEAGRQFERASCAPPFLPAAVAHFYRSASSCA
jgi:hypothetical protein